MTLNSEAMKMLVDKGFTGEDLVAFALCLEKAFPIDGAAERRRAYDRKRKADQRAKSTGHSTGSPRDPAPNDNNNTLTPSLTPIVSNETTSPELKPEHVVEVWNDGAPAWGLKPIRKLTPHRRRKLQTRIRENSIDEFTEAIAAIGRSPFLRGENSRGWRADFDWMLEPKNFTKLIEGTYDR